MAGTMPKPKQTPQTNVQSNALQFTKDYEPEAKRQDGGTPVGKSAIQEETGQGFEETNL